MLKDRLDLIIKELGLSGRQFEKECGLPTGSYSSVSDGIGANKLKQILIKFPAISLDWLIMGEEPMWKMEPRTAIQRAADELKDKTQRLEDVGNKILGTRQPSTASTENNEAWLRSVIDDQRRQLVDNAEIIKNQSKAIVDLTEQLASKGGAADAPGVAGKAAKG